MARPIVQRSPSTNNAVGATNEMRWSLGIGPPIRAIHFTAKTSAAAVLTEAESEADIELFFVELNGVRILEVTPARWNDLHRYYRQALGGNVTDDGRYTFAPHRPHLKDEVVLTQNGLALEGRKSAEWGTGGLDSVVFGLKCASSVSAFAQHEVFVEYDADERRKGEAPGEIYRVRQMVQSGLGTSWMNVQSLHKQGVNFQKLLALHVILDSGVINAQEGVQFKMGGVPFYQWNPNGYTRKARDAMRTPISGYSHIDFQALGDDLLTSCPDVGKSAGVNNFTAEINYSTAPSGSDNVIIAEDIIDWAELRAA